MTFYFPATRPFAEAATTQGLKAAFQSRAAAGRLVGLLTVRTAKRATSDPALMDLQVQTTGRDSDWTRYRTQPMDAPEGYDYYLVPVATLANRADAVTIA
jgi:chromosome condensin MukBEF MukE localization factor